MSLLEFLCVVMSNWHGFCSLHKRGRSRPLRVRKLCSAIYFPEVPEMLSKKNHLRQGEKLLFKILGSKEMLICILQLLSSACWSLNLRKQFQQLFHIWVRPLAFAADGQRHCLYRLAKLLHLSTNSLRWGGTKWNLQHYCLSGDGKDGHTSKVQTQFWSPSADTLRLKQQLNPHFTPAVKHHSTPS